MINLYIADESHTGLVAELLASLFEEVGHTPDAAQIASVFAEIDADDRHSTLLAADEEGDAVGVMTVVETLSLYAGGYIGVINELYVVPAYRSEGVGKMLLDAVKDIAAERGWMRLEVTTPGAEYEKTLRFYEREGFFPIGPRYKFELD
ncbi:MAG: GNAT family N-acetyltransferase [Lewinellaceae bacterium]|nr:GNAT family N-acetyltransferase [Lewinellaceae bacterium]